MATAEAFSAASTTAAAAAAVAAVASDTADAANTSSAAASPADDVTAGSRWAKSRPVSPPGVGGLPKAPAPEAATTAAIGARLTCRRPVLFWEREAEGGPLGKRRGDCDAAAGAAGRR